MAEALGAMALLARIAALQLQLDVAALFELSGASVAGLTFLAGVHHSDRVKALTVAQRNLFEDSKIERAKNDAATDALATSWLFAVADLQDALALAERDVKAFYASEGVIRAVHEESLSRRSAFLEAACERLALSTVSLKEALIERALNALLDQPKQVSLEHPEPDNPEAAIFLQTLGGATCADLSRLSASVNSAELMDVCDVVHSEVSELLLRRKIDTWNSRRKKLSLKFGKGIAAYAEKRALAPLAIGSEIETARHTYEELETLYDQCQSAAAALRRPKAAKGCVDYAPNSMRLRELVIDHIRMIFRLHGAEAIDTPVFELKEVLTGKYGEDSKLIYDLKDQGGEQLSLRYDLTVPFARYCGTHAVERLKRYHIGKVYRRDEPQIARGRFREFYQCDVDIAGAGYESMLPETEILALLTHVLDSMHKLIGSYVIRISHRSLLDGMLAVCRIPAAQVRAVTSAIDKLDKEPWSAVRAELVEVKGLDEKLADRLQRLVGIRLPLRAGLEAISKLEIDGQRLAENTRAAIALQDLGRLAELLPDAIVDKIELDTSLARGLDYYTGLIYEAVLTGGSAVGSIGAGGRYDNLLGMFSGKSIPAVGVSVGLERVFRLFKGSEPIPMPRCDCYVLAIGSVDCSVKAQLAQALRQKGIACEFSLKGKVPFKKELQTVLSLRCPVAVIVGPAEYEAGHVKIKTMAHPGGVDSSVEEEVALDLAPARVAQLVEASRSDLRLALFGN